MQTLIVLLLTFCVAIVTTPLTIILAKRWDIVDMPNNRKVHKTPIPTIGGVPIYISFIVGLLIADPFEPEIKPIVIGGGVLLLLGLIDDVVDLKAWIKLLVQIFVAGIVVYYGIMIDFISPFGYLIEFGFWSIPVTIIWVVGITNAFNLIDGLDGLSSGVAVIALTTIGFISILQGNIFIMLICVILIGSLLGFLVYNFHPAKIFMGDNGALLIGYIISVVSLLGFKNITLISLFFPLVILGVPFIDMFFAVIRRYKKGVSIVGADKEHLHHKLIKLGFSHRQTVILIYTIAIMFSAASIVLYHSTNWGVLIIFVLLLITIQLIVEMTGLIDDDYKPILNTIRNMIRKKIK